MALGNVQHLAGTEHALEVGRVGKAWVVVQVGILCIDLRRVLSGEVGKGVEARLMARVVDANVLATHHLRQTVVVRVLVQRAHRSLRSEPSVSAVVVASVWGGHEVE